MLGTLNRGNLPCPTDPGLVRVLQNVICMSQIESHITDLVNRVVDEGAYCCKLASVKTLAGRPMTVLVTMQCHRHNIYSFEVGSRGKEKESKEQRDSILMKQIANAIAYSPD